MDLRFFILLPIALFAAYAAFRLAAGRPVRSRGFNLSLSLLLLAYFLTTAGLGIFWVSRHELPAFDLHYLFGYLTLGLVILHVTLNWQAISAFFRRLSPGVLVEPERRRWRPALRVLGWVVALGLYAGLFFWLGLQRGARKVEVTIAAATPQENVPMSYAEPQEPPSRPAQIPPAELPAAVPLQRQMIKADGIEQPLGVYYHHQTELSLSKLAAGPALDWSVQPKVFKAYPQAEVIDLPKPRRHAETSVGAAVEAVRQPVLGFADQPISIQDLSTLLAMTNGVTATLRYPQRTFYLRAAPSAGARYPTVTYVLARNIAGLAPGLYHYGVKRHDLHRLRSGGALHSQLAEFVAHRQYVEQAPATFIFTTVFFRSGWKYSDRSYRYCCMDAGHLAVQTALTAAALGYGSQFIGRFDDAQLNAWLELDAQEEAALLIVPVGRPLEEPPAAAAEPAFVARATQLPGQKNPVALLAHGGTYLSLAGHFVRPLQPRELADKSYPDQPVVRLPEQFPEGHELLGTIQRRRSVREWSTRGLTLEQLASLLYHSFGLRRHGRQTLPDPSVEDNHALHVYVLVNAVEGLEPGVYYYRRGEQALSQVRQGSLRRAGYRAALFQDAVGGCAVAVIMTIDVNGFGWPDGDRGYRYAALDAGMLGGRLYLQAGGLGLGCCGIGAFLDDQVNELIEVSSRQELALYMVALGVKARGVK